MACLDSTTCFSRKCVGHPGSHSLEDCDSTLKPALGHAAHASTSCRYAETVIHRIFYKQDKSSSGRLSFRDLKRYDAIALRV